MKTATVILGLFLVCFGTTSPAAAECTAADTIALDLSYSVIRDSLPPAILGMAIGQTLYAPDTLLSSFTVWRTDDGINTRVKLWILKADENGIYFSYAPYYEGPMVEFYSVPPYGDVEPVEMRFEFDPPLSLPGKGWYFIAVQNTCSLYFELYTSLVDRIPGRWARTGRSNLSGCGLHRWDGVGEDMDLCYQAVFCKDDVSPVRRTTWGELKIRYR